MTLRRATVGCHMLLLVALAVTVLWAPPTPLRVAVAILLLLPLAMTLRGLIAGRRAVQQRLAVLLVAYIGGISVEVVAQAGRMPILSGALIAAVLELGLLLALTRRPAARE